MNKKKLLTMAASLAMVAVIGVGATLAYLSSTTDAKVNTFTVGKVEADLTETTTDGKEWDDTTDGKDMYPGQSVEKNPIMSIVQGSANSYAFLKVTGADKMVDSGLFAVEGFNSGNWIKVDNAAKLDGVYRYKDIITADAAKDANVVLPALFTNVVYSATAGNETIVDFGIEVVGCAVQSDGMTADEAFAQAKFVK